MSMDTIINTENNPVLVKTVDSKVAVPVDIQYHDLLDSEALPVRQVGLATIEEKILTDTVVTAGTTKNVVVDCSDSTKLYVAILASSSHTLQVNAQWMTSAKFGNKVFVTSTDDNQVVIASTTKQNCISSEIKVKSSNVRLQIINQSVTDITYNVYIYKQRV